MTIEVPHAPIDPTSAANLGERGLRFDVVATEPEAVEAFHYAVARGFLDSRESADEKQLRYDRSLERRNSAVRDESNADPLIPIATISSWVSDLTVPGGRSVPAWSITSVTVAPTHRRRGIARDLLGAELRTAASLGVPVAILTVSEATIYGRFGFAPSAMSADWTIDTTRAKWTGPTPAGRVHLVPSEAVRDGAGRDIVEAARLLTPGQAEYDGQLFERQFGLPGKPEFDAYRVARYDDEAGTPQGFVIYKNVRVDNVWTVEVQNLVTATDDAYAALWRYLFELDLVRKVTANLRPIIEPFQWQIQDARGARKTGERDHLWTRILDVKAALEARSYSAAGTFVLDITDDLDFAAGSWLLDAGAGTVQRVDAAPSDAHHLAMSVNDLAAIYLGGTSITTLVRAGRIRELSEGAAAAADASFRSPVTPWLSIWF
jgi:predicted acetyltransferase